MNGLLGGVSRLTPLADALVARGYRVLLIDPYRLSARAADVSFHGMAGEVARALEARGIDDAVVVAHGHAAGIALRLAANAPHLVTELILLEGGLLPSTGSRGVSRAMQMASIIARFPGGMSFIRSRLSAGIRANSGDKRWLTEQTARQYADGLLLDLPEATQMAQRLADAREPEPAAALLPHLHARTLVLVGAVPHDFQPGNEELEALARLPDVRVQRLAGVGHFVHEEAPLLVLREIETARASVRVTRTSARR